MAGIVLGVLQGGKTAIGINPRGTRLRAVASVSVLGPSAPTAEGEAPPPGAPGAALPSKYNKKDQTKIIW